MTPGFAGPFASPIYGGYINVDSAHGREVRELPGCSTVTLRDAAPPPPVCQLTLLAQLYYLFATSEGKATDPVVLWLNGARA